MAHIPKYNTLQVDRMKSRLVGCLVLASMALWACELPQPKPPATAEVTPAASTPKASAATSAALAQGECYYVWASHDLPAASESVNSALQAIDPRMTGSAYVYGEDCVAADGTRTFAAMETDFRVRMNVPDLGDKTQIGDSLILAMKAITGIPADKISGARPGRVDFEFYKNDTEKTNLRVSIERYRQVAPGTSGADLFGLFHVGP